MTTRFLWDAMAELEVDATTPGPRELQYWSLFKELMGRGDVPVVSSNLTYVENGEEKPVGVPYRLLERNGLKIGLIGLIGGGQFSSTKLPEGADVHWSDPIEAAKRVIPEIRSQVDLVVLMSQMSNSDTDRLIRDVEGIDVALYGNNPPWRDECAKVANTVTNSAGSRGQYLGHLLLIVGPEGELVDFGSYNRQVSEDLPERPSMAEKVAAVEAQQKEIRDAARDAARSTDLHGSSE